MSVKIRLSRIGRKNLPAYKIVVANTRDKRDGRSLDIIGHFNPSSNPQSYSIDKEKFDSWVSKGAEVTEPVEKLISGSYKYEKYTRQNEGKDTPQEEPAKKEDKPVEVEKKSVEEKSELNEETPKNEVEEKGQEENGEEVKESEETPAE